MATVKTVEPRKKKQSWEAAYAQSGNASFIVSYF